MVLTGSRSAMRSATLDRAGYPQQIIPAPKDEILIQDAREQRLNVLVANRAIDSIQTLIGHIPNARRKLQTDQVEETENQLGVAGGVSRVLVDGQLRLVVQDLIQHVSCVA